MEVLSVKQQIALYKFNQFIYEIHIEQKETEYCISQRRALPNISHGVLAYLVDFLPFVAVLVIYFWILYILAAIDRQEDF